MGAVADSDTPPVDSDSFLDSRFAPQTARRDGPFDDVDRKLEQEGQQGGGDGAGEDQRDIIEPDAPQNRLPQAAGADDGAQRREADVLHCRRADSGQHCRQGDRKLDCNEPRQGTKAQNGRRFDRPARCRRCPCRCFSRSATSNNRTAPSRPSPNLRQCCDSQARKPPAASRTKRASEGIVCKSPTAANTSRPIRRRRWQRIPRATPTTIAGSSERRTKSRCSSTCRTIIWVREDVSASTCNPSCRLRNSVAACDSVPRPASTSSLSDCIVASDSVPSNRCRAVSISG